MNYEVHEYDKSYTVTDVLCFATQTTCIDVFRTHFVFESYKNLSIGLIIIDVVHEASG